MKLQCLYNKPFVKNEISKPIVSSKKQNIDFFKSKNRKQEYYKKMLKSPNPFIVVSIGPAGTAKTMGATLIGLEKLYRNDIEKLVITRPAVAADEELGFLPGTLEDKMKAWLLPIFDTLDMVITQDEVKKMITSKKIEMCSLSHMRGRTFRNSFVIIDESQNTTISQMLMLLTRIGDNSKLVFTGDLQQHDRGYKNMEHLTNKYQKNISGLSDFVEKYRNNIESIDENHVQICEFEQLDVERHEVIPTILQLYE